MMNDDKKPVPKKPVISPVQVSNAPKPAQPVRGSSYTSTAKPNPTPKQPVWNFWKHLPEVQPWQACALALNIDPDSMERSPNNWMVPESDIFLEESFPSDEHADRFDKLSRLLEANLGNRQHFTRAYPYRDVRLDEFAAWCAPVVRDLISRDIPEELAALARAATQAAPKVEVAPAAEWDKGYYEGEAKRNGGRYQLAVAAMFIADCSTAGVDSMRDKLFKSAGAGGLKVYAPGKHEEYQFNPAPNWKSGLPLKDNEVFLEAYWNDLNDWLEKNEPRLDCQFPDPNPGARAAKDEAVPVTSPSGNGWLTHDDAENESELTPIEKRIRVIEKFADELNFPRLAIPWGGKKTLLEKCLKDETKLFGGSKNTFNAAWVEASKTVRIQIENRENYLP